MIANAVSEASTELSRMSKALPKLTNQFRSPKDARPGRASFVLFQSPKDGALRYAPSFVLFQSPKDGALRYAPSFVLFQSPK
ncbi:hypothetical protein CO059_02160 [candidate division WWE3 bacterium CG_4_9_14_0_2_um_filter_48_10]|uniref:Uncharacterized protein n=1 Tax=candidate division WWE3 bacterium CG_4_9_14_0_2_um_filter_48_10 TaxID=1975078 RepID=A0A2M8EIQ7_UNCKA|nr:MAG: hypothetical protein CO059_02160 [candidate division WWE3 bacterium CG_4_9_14_0_2_um_filter_48_10]